MEYRNKIFCEDNLETMKKMALDNVKVDIILTSPFYNTNKKAGKSATLKNTKVKDGQYNYVRYDNFVDNMTNQEYCDYTVNLFNGFNDILAKNGCVLYNMSYGSENTIGMVLAMNDIITKTDFTLADIIIWKKKSVMPNSCSSNKLTRIVEFIFVICRKEDFKTFYSNKQITSTRPTGQKMYENIYNYIEASNNDGACALNKATFSSDLVIKLLTMYAKKGSLVYDPFMGTGTTGVGCVKYGCDYIGSEISQEQCDYAMNRIEELKK